MRMIRIRKAKRTDIHSIMTIEKIFQDDQWNLQQMESELLNPYSNYLIAEIDDNLVGYCGVLCLYEQGDIQTIAVDPAFRHQGIGTLLLQAQVNYCIENKIYELFLEVDIENSHAIELYKKLGFHVMSKRKSYYANGHDAYVMKKELL